MQVELLNPRGLWLLSGVVPIVVQSALGDR